MPSIDSKEFIDQLIRDEGQFEDDMPVIAIHQYTNNWGGLTYHIAYISEEITSLKNSPFCHDIKLIWEKI